MTAPASFQPFAPDVLAEPYAFYQALRDQAPVYKLPGADYYVVSRHEDIMRVVTDPETYSSNLVAILLAAGDGTAVDLFSRPEAVGPVDVLAIQDPPIHKRQRKLTSQGFMEALKGDLEANVRKRAAKLVSDFVAKGGGEWMEEVAFVLPLAVILEILDLPQADRPAIKAWSDHSVALLGGINTPDEMSAHMMGAMEFFMYSTEKFAEAKANGNRGLTGYLVGLTQQEGEALSEDEAVSILMQLIIAGSESSASTIGSAVRLLTENPALQAELRTDDSKIPAFVEEVLRLESPFQGHFRQTTRDCELAGVTLPKGTRLMLLWASSNRDERVFPKPERIDLERPNAKKHLSFGLGLHHCLGAPLARIEIKMVIEEILSRTAEIRLREPVKHVPSVFVRTPAAMHVGFS